MHKNKQNITVSED